MTNKDPLEVMSIILSKQACAALEKIVEQNGAAPGEATVQTYGRFEPWPCPCPDLTNALDALEGLLTNKSAQMDGHFYRVKDCEGEGYEGPDMVAWGKSMELAKDVLKRGGRKWKPTQAPEMEANTGPGIMPDTPDEAPCGPMSLALVVFCKDCEHWDFGPCKDCELDVGPFMDRDNPSDVPGRRCMTEHWKGHKAEIYEHGFDGNGCDLFTAPDFFCAYGTLRIPKESGDKIE